VLWIRFWAFGDVLEAAADAFNFKRRFPYVHLTFLTHPEYADLIRLQPYVDDVITGRKKPLAEWRQTLQKVRAGRYRWVIGGDRGGHTAFLVRFSGGFCRTYRIGEHPIFPLSLNYHISLRSWLGAYGVDPEDRSAPSVFAEEAQEKQEALLRRFLKPERRLLVLIGAGNEQKEKKKWPTERWIEFLRPLALEGWGIILNGHGPAEEAIGRQIEDAVGSPNLLNLVGKLDFVQMAGVAACCSLAVGNDTGPLHLAALSGVPSMGLFARSTSRSVGLRMPWFREVCAERFAKKAPLMEFLPVEFVAREFAAFAGEFLLSFYNES
jgi:ADP-heptose:LPS heptosyltransferase